MTYALGLTRQHFGSYALHPLHHNSWFFCKVTAKVMYMFQLWSGNDYYKVLIFLYWFNEVISNCIYQQFSNLTDAHLCDEFIFHSVLPFRYLFLLTISLTWISWHYCPLFNTDFIDYLKRFLEAININVLFHNLIVHNQVYQIFQLFICIN